jgi:hypothetical protein
LQKRRPAWQAAIDLGFADAVRGFVISTLPLILLLQAATRLASYASPPLVRRDLLVLRAEQEESAIFGITVCYVVMWCFARYASRGPLGRRFERTDRSIVSDLISLWLNLLLAVTAWGLLSLDRVTPSYLLLGSARLFLMLSPMVALAPALVRLPLSLSWFSGTVLVVAAGMLGFCGRFFPFHADRVFEAHEIPVRWLADLLAGAACLLISFSFGQRR